MSPCKPARLRHLWEGLQPRLVALSIRHHPSSKQATRFYNVNATPTAITCTPPLQQVVRFTT
jgi:hypothetical protein